MELLNGKAKELFEKWLENQDVAPYKVIFYDIPIIVQQSYIIEWLRKEHKTDITIITDWIKGQRFYYSAISYINNKNEIDIWIRKDESGLKIKHEEHEEATTEAIKKAVELINESNGK